VAIIPQILPPGRGLNELAQSIVPLIKEANLWQTGGDLISAKTGLIMHTLGDRTERVVAARSTDAVSFGKKAAADPAGKPSITSE
jgi:hypothetical protein